MLMVEMSTYCAGYTPNMYGKLVPQHSGKLIVRDPLREQQFAGDQHRNWNHASLILQKLVSFENLH